MIPSTAPAWRDDYLRDLPALAKYVKQRTAWQRNSNDRFERADAELWSRVTAPEACAIFLQVDELFRRWDEAGELDAAHSTTNQERERNGLPLMSPADFRVTIARTYFQQQILSLLPAAEA